MKVSIDSEVEFNPVTLKITFETQEELSKFYHIFNFSPIVEYTGNFAREIRDSLSKQKGCDGIGNIYNTVKNSL